MKRIIFLALFSIVLIYFLSYVWIRENHQEIWEDGIAYVIFPAEKVYLYYFYRPLNYLGGTLTGIKFHIGPHR